MFDFKITPDGGETVEVTAAARDVLQWEKTTKGVSLGMLQSTLRMTDMYGIAFFAAKRTGAFTGSRESFESTCDLEILGEEEADPTQPAH